MSRLANDPACLPLDYGGPVDRPFEPFPPSALDGSVVDRFNLVVSRFGGRLAVRDLGRQLNYSELSVLVEQTAAAIAAAADGRGGPVAIFLRNEARFPAAMLAALAAGRAYIPLDAEQPVARNRLIAEQSGASAAISAGDLVDEAKSFLPDGLPVVDLDHLSASLPQRPSPPSRPESVAYVAYTSGSSGAPKGVWREHRALLHDVLQATNTLHLSCEDRVALLFSPSVNAAVRNIFGALLNGGELHILPPHDVGADDLCGELRSRGITLLQTVPTLFRRLARAVPPGERVESLRIVYLSSERSSWGDVDEVRRVCSPEAYLYSALGSTECTVHLQWFVDPGLRETHAQPPVGRAIPERRVTLVDDNGEEVADGEMGEVRVVSRYIASGYWKAPELTRRDFAADPADPGLRIFRTGDLCRRGADGLFEYIGRKDEQVKLHGHRVHPAEIESVLMDLPGVADAAVVTRKDGNGAARSLAAYVTLRLDTDGLLPRHLAAMVQQRLPSHLVPWPIRILDDLPRLPGLKVDRARLAQLDADRSAEGAERIESGVVAQIIQVFEEIIGIAGATADDNVASLGGDSLQAVDIAAELERRFAVTVSDEAMAAQTIQELALWIEGKRSIQRPIHGLDDHGR